MGFPRQEYWSGLPFPSPGDLPDPGMELASPALAGGFFTTEPPGKPPYIQYKLYIAAWQTPQNIMAWNNHHSFSLWLCGLAVWTWWIYWSCAVSLMCLWSPGWLCPWVFADCWLSPLEQLGLLLPVTWQAALCLVTYWLSMGESRSMGARLLEA